MDLNRVWSGKLDKHITHAMDLDNTFPRPVWSGSINIMPFKECDARGKTYTYVPILTTALMTYIYNNVVQSYVIVIKTLSG